MANDILEQNGIFKTSFSDTLIDLLDNGSAKYRNVMLTGPANGGKTFNFESLSNIYRSFITLQVQVMPWFVPRRPIKFNLDDFRWNP